MINYNFNQYRVSGEKAEAWSPMSYKLISKNTASDNLSGFRIGHMLYLYHVKGMTAKEIKQTAVGYGIATNMIKGVLRGFVKKRGNQYKAEALPETIEAYDIAMYMVQHEPEVMEQMYSLSEYKLTEYKM